jgi:hypothetical protein
MTPAEIGLLISAVQFALTEGQQIYDAAQLKALADVEAKLQAQLTATEQDRATTNADIDARDKQLEADLAAAEKAQG